MIFLIALKCFVVSDNDTHIMYEAHSAHMYLVTLGSVSSRLGLDKEW